MRQLCTRTMSCSDVLYRASWWTVWENELQRMCYIEPYEGENGLYWCVVPSLMMDSVGKWAVTMCVPSVGKNSYWRLYNLIHTYIVYSMCSLAVSTLDSTAVDPRSNPSLGKNLISENLRLYTTSPVVMCW